MASRPMPLGQAAAHSPVLAQPMNKLCKPVLAQLVYYYLKSSKNMYVVFLNMHCSGRVTLLEAFQKTHWASVWKLPPGATECS